MGRLFWKIFLALWMTHLLVSGVVGLVVHWYGQQRLAQLSDLAAGPRAELSVTAAALTLQHEGIAATQALLYRWQGPRGPRVLVVDESGKDLIGRRVPEALLQQAASQLKDPTPQKGLRHVTAPDARSYLLFVPADIERRNHRLRHKTPLPPNMAGKLSLTILVNVLFSAGLAWYLARPLRHLRAASRRLAAGHWDTRVMPQIGSRRDEIADLGRDFDDMVERLQQLVAAQQRLLHDVSHELRSPLARLQLAIGLARQQPEKIPSSLARIETETERLDTLVGEILTLSRLEAGVGETKDEDFDIVALLREVADDAQFEAAAKQCEVRVTAAAAVIITGREVLMQRALENVIRNAVNYTAAETRVDVSLERDVATGIVIKVCDHGPGVPDADLPYLFDPFFRASGESQRDGYGLGLAIARRAVEAHHGSIRAFNNKPSGLCIEIVLSIQPAQESAQT